MEEEKFEDALIKIKLLIKEYWEEMGRSGEDENEISSNGKNYFFSETKLIDDIEEIIKPLKLNPGKLVLESLKDRTTNK